MTESAPGFTGYGDTAFAAGSVTGIRWWTVDLEQEAPRLRGAYRGFWVPGENTASCSHDPRPGCQVPCSGGCRRRCGCGFWARWLLQGRYDHSASVVGVVEGYGMTVIGDGGFRSAKARIRGIHLPRTGERRRPLRWTPPYAEPDVWTDLRTGALRAGPAELAFSALLELVIGEIYGVPVYPDLEALLASHPPTTDYIA